MKKTRVKYFDNGLRQNTRDVAERILASDDKFTTFFRGTSYFQLWQVLLGAVAKGIAPIEVIPEDLPLGFIISWKQMQKVMGKSMSVKRALELAEQKKLEEIELNMSSNMSKARMRVLFIRMLPHLHLLKGSSIDQFTLGYTSVLQMPVEWFKEKKQYEIITQLSSLQNKPLDALVKNGGRQPFESLDATLKSDAQKGFKLSRAVLCCLGC
jgi:hypothetical protein